MPPFKSHSVATRLIRVLTCYGYYLFGTFPRRKCKESYLVLESGSKFEEIRFYENPSIEDVVWSLVIFVFLSGSHPARNIYKVATMEFNSFEYVPYLIYSSVWSLSRLVQHWYFIYSHQRMANFLSAFQILQKNNNCAIYVPVLTIYKTLLMCLFTLVIGFGIWERTSSKYFQEISSASIIYHYLLDLLICITFSEFLRHLKWATKNTCTALHSKLSAVLFKNQDVQIDTLSNQSGYNFQRVKKLNLMLIETEYKLMKLNKYQETFMKVFSIPLLLLSVVYTISIFVCGFYIFEVFSKDFFFLIIEISIVGLAVTVLLFIASPVDELNRKVSVFILAFLHLQCMLIYLI